MSKPRLKTDCADCASQGNSVFCSIEHMGMEQLNLEKNTNEYKKGQTLFIQGNPSFGLYCVSSGKIKITKVGSGGKETIVRIASGGDLLGHRSLFSDSPYTASAVVIEDSKICFISKSTIQKLIQSNPPLSFQIINRISTEMGAAEERIASLSQKNVRERFAELLLLMSQSYGVKENGKIRLDIKLTREEMASMIGAATENLIRLMSEFKDEGAIEQDGKTLFILDMAYLEKYADLDH